MLQEVMSAFSFPFSALMQLLYDRKGIQPVKSCHRIPKGLPENWPA